MPFSNRPIEFTPKTESNLSESGSGRQPSRYQSLRQHFKAKTILHSFGFAWQGIRYAFATQRNFRIHFLMATMAIGLSWFLGISPIEWAMIIGLIGLVLFAELTNTAIEQVVDMVTHGEFDARAKVAKDLAAGAVFITAIAATTCGLAIFLPHLVRW